MKFVNWESIEPAGWKLHQLLPLQIKNSEMGWLCGTKGRYGKSIRVTVGGLGRKTTQEKLTEMGHIRWEIVNCINLAVVTACCEHGSDPVGSLTAGEFLH
jgi:hypothetical protein